ncbi:flagellar biosynthesis anti-sigma factor FlgM [Clostridia bacterium OttesenSCG-928-F22]|nr:flagellar biosynthesis anti-sigma factor FlgM [Clostridia bacterium OttesenSCG-928-F22]
MRINSIPPRDLYHKYVHTKGNVPAASYSLSADKVELTGDAQTFSATLKAAKEAMEQASVTNTNKVENIRQQIESNTYFVPGYMVAGRMLGQD